MGDHDNVHKMPAVTIASGNLPAKWCSMWI